MLILVSFLKFQAPSNQAAIKIVFLSMPRFSLANITSCSSPHTRNLHTLSPPLELVASESSSELEFFVEDCVRGNFSICFISTKILTTLCWR